MTSRSSAAQRLDRQHWNANGTAKRSFTTRGAALAARRSMAMSHVNIYKCPVCRHWHHGHREAKR